VNTAPVTTRTIPVSFGGEIFEAKATIQGPVYPGYFLSSVSIPEPDESPTVFGSEYCVKRNVVASPVPSQTIPDLPEQAAQTGWDYSVTPNPKFKLVRYGDCQTSIDGEPRDLIQYEFQFVLSEYAEIDVITDSEVVDFCHYIIDTSVDDNEDVWPENAIVAFSTWIGGPGSRTFNCSYYFNTSWVQYSDSAIWNWMATSTPGSPNLHFPPGVSWSGVPYARQFVIRFANYYYYEFPERGNTPYTIERDSFTSVWWDRNYTDVTGGSIIRDFIPQDSSHRRWPTENKVGCFLLSSGSGHFNETVTNYPTPSPTTPSPTPRVTPRPTLDYRPLKPGGYVGLAFFGAAWIAFMVYIFFMWCK
jgi:hypothetical protein